MEDFKDKDYYRILGINHSAALKEVKAAYRSLARKYHPDVNQGNKADGAKFKEISEAYKILADQAKRKQYDLYKGYREPSEKIENHAQKSEIKKKSFYETFLEFLDKNFSQNGGKKSPPKKKSNLLPEKGDDITADVSISISEAYNGTTRKINILHTEQCRNCKGRKIINNLSCPVCDGNGEISSHKKISVKIPANIKKNTKIRIPNEGNRGLNGGKNGDLYLIIHIKKNSLFTVENLNVLCEIPITPTEAALGTEINVPTIEGSVSMKIPPETSSDQKFRLTNRGISDAETKKKGDQIIKVKIEIPKNLTEKEKQLYQELSKIRKFNPRENIIYGQENEF